MNLICRNVSSYQVVKIIDDIVFGQNGNQAQIVYVTNLLRCDPGLVKTSTIELRICVRVLDDCCQLASPNLSQFRLR